ncbi:DNA polymerase III, chi subunit [Idiomarina sp. A28L]|uniref:DNA polymerase III subunit chi n=1 Tax=Idiomarina sp. A28L TaxID=1036674 RepID=UPI00021388EE|nr:DNA polymerase III subunit chi [Idiomarina sp. A28L]EGN76193.1 DNA polymerase III, chi subunit [Idiomarina sp. A28L]
MARVTFYVVNNAAPAALLNAVCKLIAQQFNQRRRIVIFGQDQAQAEAVDELLWQIPAERFIPHNLVGEGPIAGTPVLIGWDQPAGELSKQRNVVFNLRHEVPELTRHIQEIIDFVPADEAGKELARERYRHYRQLGMQMATLPAPE